ncbi:hypothetical protein M409DRAFT_54008 [Zasmidium cellare ATCC 36951]|uniref:Uncharacterized protein n=1 Tax=Zasmidium cellare ATCC 36951 TaxID=1080233 RepID=A0A6A6CPL3_ZASCE|nr:uncharacterized protein M409DRAFT_54008 [Zasmidium cellare ATCC 36951]KAF2167406.1 hypothetical protein M409DRAFT_54008 [Zasmidium cellare ATCC 36951]
MQRKSGPGLGVSRGGVLAAKRLHCDSVGRKAPARYSFMPFENWDGRGCGFMKEYLTRPLLKEELGAEETGCYQTLHPIHGRDHRQYRNPDRSDVVHLGIAVVPVSDSPRFDRCLDGPRPHTPNTEPGTGMVDDSQSGSQLVVGRSGGIADEVRLDIGFTAAATDGREI